MSNFKDALKSPSAKRQYPKRLKYFFDSLYTKENENFAPSNIDIQEQMKEFMDNKDDKPWIEGCFRKMLRVQKKRVECGEIQESTIYNYYKAAKVFCDQNDIVITWKKITNMIPTGRRDADDRIPTDDEIQRLVKYPDRRIKGIVYTMLSSGIRIEAWNYLKWKHVQVMKNDEGNKILAAKLIVYAGEREQYYSFITPEAYNHLKDYMDYRAHHGEQITDNSWIIRNAFDSLIKNGSNLGKATEPRQLKDSGIKSLLERAAKSEGLFPPLIKGQKRREWKVSHGLRKYFKTKCENAGMRSLHIEMLLGHNTGVTKSYYRPLESEMLEDYHKAVELLTVEETNKKVDKIKTEIRKEMQEEIYKLKKDFLVYRYEQKAYQICNFWENQYAVDGIVKPTPDLPKEKLEEFLNEFADPKLTIEELAIITPQEVLEDLKLGGEKLSEDDLKILNDYIVDEQPYEILDLPNIVAKNFGVEPDEVKNMFKQK